MNRFNKLLCVITLSIYFFSPFSVHAQDAVRNSLKLHGAMVNKMAATPDGNLILAATEGPYGIFYTNSWGGEWNLGVGGDYEAGTGSAVVATSTKIYAVLGNGLYSSTPTTPTDWEQITIDGVTSVSCITFADDRLFVGTNSELIVYDGSAVIDRENLPATGQVRNIAVSSDAGYVFIELAGENLTADFYRISYEEADGSLGTSWTDVTPPGVDSGKFFGLAVDPLERVYVSTFNAGNGDDGTYRSSDDGSSYALITETNYSIP